MIPRTAVTPSRWAWLLPVAATLLVVGCEDSLDVDLPDDIWGFVFLDATEPAPGDFQVQPEAFFFRGRLSAVPNAANPPDSCNTVAFSPLSSSGPPLGVTTIDAGDAVGLQIGAAQEQLDRIVGASQTVYEYAGGFLAYTPGDSVIITVPGAVGGFPQGTVRARTAEPFTMSTIDPPLGTETIHFTWTAASTPQSAMIVSLRFATSGQTLNRQVLCAFTDDGADSIKYDWYGEWAASPVREVVATRLRTTYATVGGATLGVVSTFPLPTPQAP